jgi:hypothetical protein
VSKTRRIDNAASTSTGALAAMTLGPVGSVSAAVIHDSTKQVAWKLQGDIGGVGAWEDLMVATSSTGVALAHSTAAGTWTNVRVNITANGSTGDVTSTWFVAGR